VATYQALRRRALPTYDVSSRVRLTKTPGEYLATRDARRELSYEALLQNGVSQWRVGQRVSVYRAQGGRAGLWREDEGQEMLDASLAHPRVRFDPRDYDSTYYIRLLRTTYAARLARALSVEHFNALIADPEQLTLFAPRLDLARPILTLLASPVTVIEPEPLANPPD
jgi:hypothetical protein